MTYFLKCIESVPVKNAPIINHFTEGKVYPANKTKDGFTVWDNFREKRDIFGAWIREHFVVTDNPINILPETKEMSVWTNGKAIRKYTGQDKQVDYNSVKRNGTWYKARAIIVPYEEEMD